MNNPSADPFEEAERAAAAANTAMKDALAKLPVYRGPEAVEAAPVAPDAYEPLYAE